MENSTLDNDFTTPAGLTIDPETQAYLKETAKWAKFLAIVGFIMAGFMVIMGLFMGTMMSTLGSGMGGDVPGFPMWIMSAIYILFAILYIMPMLYMYRFATKMQTALLHENQTVLTSSFENLKSLFKFAGIMTIIMLALYAVMILGSMLVGFMAF